eukprot:184157-Prorocentrum_minimum.AAC.2
MDTPPTQTVPPPPMIWFNSNSTGTSTSTAVRRGMLQPRPRGDAAAAPLVWKKTHLRRKLPCPYGRVVGSPRWAPGVPGEPRFKKKLVKKNKKYR